MRKLLCTKKLFSYLTLFVIFFCLVFVHVRADQYTSSDYQVVDPVMDSGGTYANSSSYGLYSSFSQLSPGPSTATDFGVNAGFQYYPYVSSPVVSATAGNAQVNLSWTSAGGALGWTVGGYDVGVATVSGGPYNYTSSLGNTLSYTASSLSNNVTYYFVVRAEDAFGNPIATSSQASATPVAPPPSGGGGGGGGGGGLLISPTQVNFSGRAYPSSVVTLLKDAQVVATTVAGTDSNFAITLNGMSPGNYVFSIYSEDADGNRSSLLSFPVGVTSGATTNITGIFIAPTIAVDKSEVKQGDNIAIFGQSTPNANIIISVHSDPELFVSASSDVHGAYLYNFDTSPLDIGQHTTKSKAATGTDISEYGTAVNFNVGNENVAFTASSSCPQKGDLNGDCKVDLVDFSIAAYWYKKTLSAAFAKIEAKELNGDDKIDLTDFSIMAYYWTG